MNSSNRLDRIEAAIERTQLQIDVGFQRTQQQIDSNARAIEALSADRAANRSDIAANRSDIAATRASVDGLVQTIAEFSIRSEARLNRLDDVVVGLERILEQLLRRDLP